MIPSLQNDARICGGCPLRRSPENLRAAVEGLKTSLLFTAVEKNRVLRTENAAERLVTVRQGMLKVEGMASGGDPQVLGFLVRGESILLSSMRQRSLAITSVEASTVCEVDIDKVRGLVPDAASFFEGLAALAVSQSESLGRPPWIAAPARLRLKLFLSDLARRQGSADEVALPMSREDLAHHLAMRPETLSRAIAALVKTKEITLISIHSVALNGR